ncbi:hypothetical protein BGZ65_006352 [Modicella reniformis]|uniref:Crinkler effector protein N-terminal domain-containing protein n=1 Tax=Modicella reniformis TaxID=1440133 RepID=A0A9P6LTV6_9FUNG|nr:hypothetical protein BGZ65_006352 [Modicella reniformis]
MANLMLFCLVERDPTSKAFEVKIPKTCTVSNLRDKIKERIPKFKDIAAHEFTLWRVSIPVVAANKHKPIVLNEIDSATELDPTDDLSDVFEGKPPKKTIHIIVQPPSATQNDPEIAMLRKQLSELRSTSISKQKGWRNLTVSLDSPAKNFSSYTWKDIVSLYEVGDIPELLPTFHIQPKPLTTKDEIEVLEHIVKDCTFKNEAYVFGSGASEATKSTIVDAFMVGAMQFYKSEMVLAQQHQMSGQRGHGPVDFAVIDRKFQTQVLGVTEVKKDDHIQGLAQNMVQLDVAVHHKKRKRAEETDEDIDERAPVSFKSFGIVTDSFKWVIVECTSENDTVTFRTKEALGLLPLKDGVKALREGCKVLFGYILALYELMKNENMNRSSRTMSRSPSIKRFAGSSTRI